MDTDYIQGEWHVKLRAETWVMLLQAMENGMENIASKTSKLKLEAWDRFSQPSKRISPANTLILDC